MNKDWAQESPLRKQGDAGTLVSSPRAKSMGELRGHGTRTGALTCTMIGAAVLCLVVVASPSKALAQKDSRPASASQVATSPASMPAGDVNLALPAVGSQGGASSNINWILVVTAVSIAPAIVVLMTCFTRIIVVLSLLRAALASQQLPPNQVLFGLALLMTVVVMWPTYGKIHQDAVGPYLAGQMSQSQALQAGESHARDFMIRQIESAGNSDEVFLFMDKDIADKTQTWGDVPTRALIPGYAVSELKVAFAMGFKIFLPFLIVDMLVSSVLVSMGMLMLPPVLISLPFKLLLFVLADGWHLVVGTLMNSLR